MQARTRSPLESIAYTPAYMAAAKRFSEVESWRTSLAIARQWAIIGTAFAAAIYTGNVFVYAAAFVVIASRQQALASLMHEASHRRLYKNPAVNHFVSNLFCALPIALSVSRYGDEHADHHKAPNTDADPYWVTFQANPTNWSWPKTKRGLLSVLVRDFFGLNTMISGREVASWTPFANHFSTEKHPIPLPMMERLQLYVLYPAVAVALTLTGGWFTFLVLWLLPMLTLTPVFVRIRAISEHSALKVANGTDATRHVDAHWLEYLCICSFNINYHLVHHLFPYVTYYNLPKMHDLLMQNPEFRKLAHVSHTYLGKNGVLRSELTVTAA
jgi:fatty acid desaturase